MPYNIKINFKICEKKSFHNYRQFLVNREKIHKKQRTKQHTTVFDFAHHQSYAKILLDVYYCRFIVDLCLHSAFALASPMLLFVSPLVSFPFMYILKGDTLFRQPVLNQCYASLAAFWVFEFTTLLNIVWYLEKWILLTHDRRSHWNHSQWMLWPYPTQSLPGCLCCRWVGINRWATSETCIGGQAHVQAVHTEVLARHGDGCQLQLWLCVTGYWLVWLFDWLHVQMSVQEVQVAVCACSTRCRLCSATSMTVARSRHAMTTATGCQHRSRWRRWWTRSLGLRYEIMSAAVPSVRRPHRFLSSPVSNLQPNGNCDTLAVLSTCIPTPPAHS